MSNCTQYILKTWLFLLLSLKISCMHIAFFVSECYHIFIFIIIYLYLSLYIYIDYYIFIWFIIQSVVGVIGIVGNILTILVLSTKVRNQQWWQLFEKLEMMKIIWNIGNDENYFLFEISAMRRTRKIILCSLQKFFFRNRVQILCWMYTSWPIEKVL